MRRIQLYIDADIDDALSAEAARLSVSRSALVREAVRKSLGGCFDRGADAVDEIIGCLDIEAGDESIDDVVYGPGR